MKERKYPAHNSLNQNPLDVSSRKGGKFLFCDNKNVICKIIVQSSALKIHLIPVLEKITK
jgi:hypothetical protein